MGDVMYRVTLERINAVAMYEFSNIERVAIVDNMLALALSTALKHFDVLTEIEAAGVITMMDDEIKDSQLQKFEVEIEALREAARNLERAFNSARHSAD